MPAFGAASPPASSTTMRNDTRGEDDPDLGVVLCARRLPARNSSASRYELSPSSASVRPRRRVHRAVDVHGST